MMTIDSRMQLRLTIVFALLIGATAASWAMGHGLGFPDQRHASTFVLLVAFIKARFVFLDFMEVRHAPKTLRVLAEGWIIAVFVAVTGLYWLASDPTLTAHWPIIQGLTDFSSTGVPW